MLKCRHTVGLVPVNHTRISTRIQKSTKWSKPPHKSLYLPPVQQLLVLPKPNREHTKPIPDDRLTMSAGDRSTRCCYKRLTMTKRSTQPCMWYIYRRSRRYRTLESRAVNLRWHNKSKCAAHNINIHEQYHWSISHITYLKLDVKLPGNWPHSTVCQLPRYATVFVIL